MRKAAGDFEVAAAAVLVNAEHTAALLRSAARMVREFEADYQRDARGDGEEGSR